MGNYLSSTGTDTKPTTLMIDYNEVYNLAIGGAAAQILINIIAAVTIILYWKYFKHLFTSGASHLPTEVLSKVTKKLQFL